MVEPTKLSQAEFFAKLVPESQAFLQQPDLHAVAQRMRDGLTVAQAEINKLLKLGSGGQGDIYDLKDCCLKFCPQFKVGDMHPAQKNIEISQTAGAIVLNAEVLRFGENEWTRLLACQHRNVVPIYAFGYTDEGNLIILIARAECDLKSHYERIIEQHPPPAIEDDVKRYVRSEMQC